MPAVEAAVQRSPSPVATSRTETAGRREREPLGVGVEAHSAGDAVRQVRRGLFLVARRSREFADGDLGVAVNVARVGEPAGLVVQRDAVDVPLAPVLQRLDRKTLDVQPDEFERIGVPVGTAVDRLAVGSPGGTAVPDVPLVGRQVSPVAGGEVEFVEVLVETGVALRDDDAVVARAPAGQREPAVALVDQFSVLALFVPALHVDVEHGLVAAVRGEGDAVAVV
jgi:hypothetical protein